MEKKKIKILTLSDHPLSPSGVGIQTKYFIIEMLKTGKFSFVSLGGAIRHANPNPIMTDEFKEDWLIIPIEGYGNPELIRSALRQHKPDILWFMTDPRFYLWLWAIENEIRSLVPMVYYHVWDNFPVPQYNKLLYQSTDKIVTISKLTDAIVKASSPTSDTEYLPHAIPTEIFKKLPDDLVSEWRAKQFPWAGERTLFFWNNRNARRKQSGTLIKWFKTFLDQVGHDKATLLLHTDSKDINGQDLDVVIQDLGLHTQQQVIISPDKVEPNLLAMLYNAVDCTINISDAEGFGLATFESLSCETPIIVNMTGGLQEQVTNITQLSEEILKKRSEEHPGATIYEHGIGIEPASRALIGSQETPYIFEDRLAESHFVDALMKFYNSSKEQREAWGKAGREHVLKNYSFEKFISEWERILLEVHQKHGSWSQRNPQHKSWELLEVK